MCFVEKNDQNPKPITPADDNPLIVDAYEP